VVAQRFDVVLLRLDPTEGREIRKTRPALVVSPDEINLYSQTVIVAPMTTRGVKLPTRVTCEFEGKKGQIVLDQVRTVDKSRFVRRLGRLPEKTGKKALAVLQEMFNF